MAYLSKYGVARKIRIPMVKRGVVDHAVSADWTPAAGDVKISKDGGAAANVTNLPTAIAMGNSTIWEFSFTATEMQAAQVNVTIGDTATKAVEDSGFDIETYGNASAQHAVDLSDGVRAGLTALPNAAAEAAGGLFTRGTGAGQIAQDANGRISVNLVAILGTLLTETAGQIAAGFKKVFDVASPVFTAASVNQTGDAYARVGAPAGASIAADIAAAKVDTAAIKTQTDKMVFTVANQLDVNVKSNGGTAITAAAGVQEVKVASIAANAITAASMAADASQEIRAEIDANSTQLEAIYARVGAPAGASIAADIAAVKVDTGNIYGKVDTEIADLITSVGVGLGTLVTAIKAKTDSLTFTKPGEIDANIQSVNDTTVQGAGTAGSPWGP